MVLKAGGWHGGNTVVRARIDPHIKGEAAAVLGTMSFTVSNTLRLMMVRIAREKALPFEPLVPDAETVEAMKAARRVSWSRLESWKTCSRV